MQVCITVAKKGINSALNGFYAFVYKADLLKADPLFIIIKKETSL